MMNQALIVPGLPAQTAAAPSLPVSSVEAGFAEELSLALGDPALASQTGEAAVQADQQPAGGPAAELQNMPPMLPWLPAVAANFSVMTGLQGQGQDHGSTEATVTPLTSPGQLLQAVAAEPLPQVTGQPPSGLGGLSAEPPAPATLPSEEMTQPVTAPLQALHTQVGVRTQAPIRPPQASLTGIEPSAASSSPAEAVVMPQVADVTRQAPLAQAPAAQALPSLEGVASWAGQITIQAASPETATSSAWQVVPAPALVAGEQAAAAVPSVSRGSQAAPEQVVAQSDAGLSALQALPAAPGQVDASPILARVVETASSSAQRMQIADGPDASAADRSSAVASSGQGAAAAPAAQSTSVRLGIEDSADADLAGLTVQVPVQGELISPPEPMAAPVLATAARMDVGQAGAAQVVAPQPAAAAVPTEGVDVSLPIKPHWVSLEGGAVQVEVLRMARDGGGQVTLELTPPDQGRYRLDLRIDDAGQAMLVVEGASESMRTRLEMGESALREQFAGMGLQLQLQMRSQSDAGGRDSLANAQAQGTGHAELGPEASVPVRRAVALDLDRGLVRLYA